MADENKTSLGSYRNCAKAIHGHFGNLRYGSCFGNSTLALSIPSHRKICFVTADRKFTVKGEIECVRIPKAIYGLNNGDIALSWDNPVAFGVISGQLWTYKEKVYFTDDKSGRKLKSFDYISVDEERQHVIQPCKVDKTVYCFDFDGQPIFKYTSAELKDPGGVGVDYEGNIYVCDTAGVCIHVVSLEGQAVCIIKEGCPKKPLAIGFSIDGKSFAVTQSDRNWASVCFFSIVSE